MKKYWIFIIAYFLITLTKAQNQKLYIKGRVVDESHLPVYNANIMVVNSQKGTITDRNGFFNLALPQQAVNLEISHVGYHSQIQRISKKDIQKSNEDTVFLFIVIEIYINELMPVEVSGEKVQLAYNKPELAILDFDFFDNGILLLLFDRQNYILRLIDFNQTTKLNLSLNFIPEYLFSDCLGNKHIVSKDSIYQVYTDSNQLKLLQSFTLKDFYNSLINCVTETNKDLIFRQYGKHNQSIYYYRVNKKNKKDSLFVSIVDTASFEHADATVRRMNKYLTYYDKYLGNISIEDLAKARDYMQTNWFYQNILTTPTYNPLFRFRDSIFVFNHINSMIEIYNENENQIRSVPIEYHLNNGWKNEIIIDSVRNDIYAKFNRSGLVWLFKINPDNGEIISKFKLEQNVFPEKIKVKDGIAYYLYAKKENFALKNLYMQKLDF